MYSIAIQTQYMYCTFGGVSDREGPVYWYINSSPCRYRLCMCEVRPYLTGMAVYTRVSGEAGAAVSHCTRNPHLMHIQLYIMHYMVNLGPPHSLGPDPAKSWPQIGQIYASRCIIIFGVTLHRMFLYI